MLVEAAAASAGGVRRARVPRRAGRGRPRAERAPARLRRSGRGRLEPAGPRGAAPLKEREGLPLRRQAHEAALDGPRIVTGRAVYGLDVRVPGMRFAAVARCAGAGRHASRASIASRAKARSRRARRRAGADAASPSWRTDTWAAHQGRATRWTSPGTRGRTRRFDSAAFRRSSAKACASRPATGAARKARCLGGRSRSAARRIEAVYEYAFQAHAAVEPHRTALADVRGRRLRDLVAARRRPNSAPRAMAAEMTGLAAEAGPRPRDAARRRLRPTPGSPTYALRGRGGLEGREGAGPGRLDARGRHAPRPFYHPPRPTCMAAGLDAAGDLGRVGPPRRRFLSLDVRRPPEPISNDPESCRDASWAPTTTPTRSPAFEHRLQLRGVAGSERAVARRLLPALVTSRASRSSTRWRSGRPRPACVPARSALRAARADARGGSTLDRRPPARVLEIAAERSGWGQPLAPGRGRGIACNIYHRRACMAQVAEVSVARAAASRWTGSSRRRCGPVVNPLGAEGQVESGVAWGLSAALKTEITIRNGPRRAVRLRGLPGAAPGRDAEDRGPLRAGRERAALGPRRAAGAARGPGGR